MVLRASILTMRSHAVPQPVPLLLDHNDNKNNNDKNNLYFCWNGEVYQRLNDNNNSSDKSCGSIETVAGYNIVDTELVASMLREAHQQVLQECSVSSTSAAAVAAATAANASFLQAYTTSLSRVFGRLVNAEYSFCLVTPWAIYYGRDPHGRRSLLYCTQESVVERKTSSEDVDKNNAIDHSVSSSKALCWWKLASVVEDSTVLFDETHGSNNTTAPVWTEVVPGKIHEYRFDTQQMYSTPIVHHVLPLLSSCVQSSSLLHVPRIIPDDNVSPSMWDASLKLEYYLRQAVQLRICGTSSAANNATIARTTTTHQQSVAVLFSGGIDSVVLAALALQVLPPSQPLRLWNVSFVDTASSLEDSNDLTTTTVATTTTKSQDCRAAQASYEELLDLFPDRQIYLETSEVAWEEMTQQEAHIRTLIHPKTTTMDLNIGMALWFASRGRTKTTATTTASPPTPAPLPLVDDPRILLVGMGADEQLGGYGRHRKAFEQGLQQGDGRNGNIALRQELDLDIARIWERNLGRDDRIFSDHGKEARFPYLDHHVMNFLKQLSLDDICDFGLPPGQGDKRILRLLAMRLGLKSASGMVKRAIQFGSRISHVSDKRRFGSRRKAKGTATV